MRPSGSIACVRKPTQALARCELSYVARTPIDIDLAQKQHSAYVAALAELGAQIEWLPPLPDHPDAVFVEDTAVLVSDLAILARPGAPLRRGEVRSVAQALSAHRKVRRIEAPASLDGGDVLPIGNTLFVGMTARTNAAAVTALRRIIEPRDGHVVAVPVTGCLHLKSACTFIPPDTLVANCEWIDRALFRRVRIIETDRREPAAGNTLTLGGCTLVSASAPRTAEKLRRAGVNTRSLDISELEKAEAGLTCMSLVLA